MNCKHCEAELEYDAVNPFCDECWCNALYHKEPNALNAIYRWTARLDE